jgi:hypothetical protein
MASGGITDTGAVADPPAEDVTITWAGGRQHLKHSNSHPPNSETQSGVLGSTAVSLEAWMVKWK